ncbi:hypothetical protein DPMN_133929 [Dreissena polymorpha]|uniref:Uncharacterized protein n=1 Tax=Dreissena polymorpha TaxID=45954 RepID=A0A9D4JDC9_DREPO|nr:hypothetical protein DPMN_133929 [Dreissena polymorpha]
MLEDVTSELPVKLIDCYNCFVYGNGHLANQLFRPDGIHPNIYGSSLLVAAINEVVHITKKRMQQQQHRKYHQNQRRRTFNVDFTDGNREYLSAKSNFPYGLRGFRNGYRDFRKGHHDFCNGHHDFIRHHDLRNAHQDTRSEHHDCQNENRDFRYVRRYVNHENSRHCTN